jgi:hypothetical protein
MSDLFLNDEQADFVSRAEGRIVVRDAAGHILGRLEPELSAMTLAELKRKASSAGPWYSGEQVQARLKSLQEEWDRTGGFDEARMHELLQEMNKLDPGPTRQPGQ